HRDPPTFPTRRSSDLWRWCRRNPAVATLAATLAGLMFLTTAGALLAAAVFRDVAGKERAARAEAEDHADANRRQLARQYVGNGRSEEHTSELQSPYDL